MGRAGRTTATADPHRLVPTAMLTASAAVLCLAATAVVITSPALLFGVHDPALHLVLDSVDACIALLVAYLLLGRFRRERSATSLMIAGGLVLLATAAAAGSLPEPEVAYTLEVWVPQTLRGAGALLLLAGAVLPERRVRRRRALLGLAGAVGVLVVLLSAMWALRDGLPVAIATTPRSALQPDVTGHPALLVSHLLGAVCFAVAALAFTTRARRTGDEMLRWFAPAAVLGTFSRVHYMLFPSIYSGWLYTGDLLRTGCYLLLLVGAAREINRYWAEQPRIAVAEDRRRLARELHDGVLQELGFIAAESGRIGEERARRRIGSAARRGLEEARAAVDSLAHGGDDQLSLQLHRAARQLTERYGARIVVDLDVSVEVDREQAHALVRIAREAVGNAIRHGGAQQIGLGLHRDHEGRRLVVTDEGTGFDPDAAAGRGYGLTSMRDRAAGLPGELRVESRPGTGTTVTVTW